MLEQGGIVSIHGKCLPTTFHSICVHGDNAQAADSAAQIRRRLEELGYRMTPLADMRLA